MKKLISSLLAAFLLGTGLVAFSGSTTPASAVCGDAAYPACFNTTTALLVEQVRGTKYEFTAGVVAEGTNRIPRGTFDFRLARVRDGFGTKLKKPQVIRFSRAVPSDGIVEVRRNLRPGTYNAVVSYDPNPGRTIFRESKSENVQFTVDRPRRGR